MTRLRIDDDQRRARLARRHLVCADDHVDDPVAIARGVVALHSSDPATVHLSVMTRADAPSVDRTERALYDDRSLVRMLGMRRTLFVVPADLVPVVQAASADDIAAAERRRFVRAVAANGIADPERWLRTRETAALDALIERGGAHTSELNEAVPRLRDAITVGSGRWQTDVRAASRVLPLLAAHGRIVRGRPRGTWLSSQYRWVPTEQWLGGPITPMPADEARADLARRWLAAYGPATFDDLVWWSGWTRVRTRRAVAALDVVDVDLDDGTVGLVLADDTMPVPAPAPWAALLPSLDPTPMGWKARDWYLGSHGDAVFDRNGNVGPTIWWNGRIVGGWAQRPDGTVVHRVLDDVDGAAAAAIAAAVGRLQEHLGGVAVTARFRSPLDRELTA